jgi:hypothetical protein
MSVADWALMPVNVPRAVIDGRSVPSLCSILRTGHCRGAPRKVHDLMLVNVHALTSHNYRLCSSSMSLCSNTFRALSRSRVPPSKTLLPFLYQTVTIQQWHLTRRPTACRNISSRSNKEDDIPFENGESDLPPAIDNARKTTMTNIERAAFEKLYKTFNTQGKGRARDGNGDYEEMDQVADEYYEDEEESSGKSLDEIFDTVLQGTPRSQATQRDNRKLRTAKIPGDASHAANMPSTPEVDTLHGEKKRNAKAERDKIKKLRMEERERVDTLLKSAHTDRKVWEILEREVFDQLRKLDLDGPTATKKERTKINTPKSKSKTNSSPISDKRNLFPNYPHYLHTALFTLRAQFPASQLPLTLLPTIKAIGRSSYALGATTVLYKQLIRTAWLQQSSYTLIDTLLTDMESNAVEFDAGILEVLNSVIRDNDLARAGQFGRETQMVYGMEQWVEGIGRVVEWRDVVAKRLGVNKDEPVAHRAPEKMRREVGGGGARDARDWILVEGTNGVGRSVRKTGDAIPIVRKESTVAGNTELDGGVQEEGEETDGQAEKFIL